MTVGKIHHGWKERLLEATDSHPSFSADAGQLGPCWVAAASLAGSSHRHRQQVREDAYALSARTFGDSEHFAIAALADGASSQPHAEFGARSAVDAAVRITADWLGSADAPRVPTSDELQEIVWTVSDRVRQAASQQEHRPEDLACTLLVAVIGAHPERPDGLTATLASVGDSELLQLRSTDFSNVLAPTEDAGDVLRDFVPLKTRTQIRGATCDIGPGEQLVLASDGVAKDIHTSESVRTWLAAQWAAKPSALAAANALAYRRQGSHDDRTAVIFTPLGG
ncbi:MAG: protein phosphatase 2C domain-containing protein [Patulibacter sp.]|nr:protein phosphatase 2C domain-containing protein [Patulibacter sp.]